MVTTTVLDNGVRVITQQIPSMHTVTTGIWVANGSRHEQPETNGIAHFIEHLLFKGTPTRTARQISLEMDSLGGILNAFTGHEYVCYYAKVLSAFLPRAIALLSDIFLHSSFPADELERERKVILQEIKMRDDSPDEFIHDRFHQSFWNGHPLGMPIIGNVETVGGMSRDAIISYKTSRYRPEDVIIAAAGNVDHNRLLGLISNDFGALTSAWTPDEQPACSSHVTHDVNCYERELEQTLLCLGTKGYSHNHPDRYALFLLNTVLGGGMSSRLFQEIREKKGLAYSVYSYLLSHADSGALVVFAGTERSHCREVLDIILAELARLVREMVGEDELLSAREQLKGKILMSLESSESLMTRIAKNLIYLGEYQPVDDVIACFDSVSCDDMFRVANELLHSTCYNLDVIGPVKGLDVSIPPAL